LRRKNVAVGDASGAAAGKIAVTIPAWEPAGSLIQFVSSLLELSFGLIIVVDDGSGAVFHWISKPLSGMPAFACCGIAPIWARAGR
jgi:hypothetical protein